MNQPERRQPAAVWCPERIDVIGGGLWSRVIVETLCGMVPPTVDIAMHSAHNHALLRDWAARQKFANRVRITAAWQALPTGGSGALIIANAARDHAKTLERALPWKIPVLVEKPFTMTAAETTRLMALAAELRANVAASQVFLFAGYLQGFKAMLADMEPIRHLAFRWSDPPAEFRHGGRKSYDPGLPLHVDVLPHVSSLIGALLPDSSQACRSLTILRGGAQLRMELDVGDIPCHVELARNAAARERVIEVTAGREPLALDFTREPRVITGDGRILNADPDWGIKAGPLASMLKAFLIAANGGPWDSRLSAAIALRGNQLADEATPFYRRAVASWLAEALPRQGVDADHAVLYALRELFHARRPAEPELVDQRIDEALRTLRGASTDDVIDFIAKEP